MTDALQSTTFRLYSSAAAPVTGAAAPRQPLPRCQGTKCRPGKRLRGVNPLKGVLGLVMIALLVFDDAAALRVLAPMSWSSSGRLACSNEPPALQMGARGGEVGSNDWLRTRAKVVVIDERRAFPSRYKAALVQRAQSFLTSFVQRGGDDGQFYGVRGGGDIILPLTAFCWRSLCVFGGIAHSALQKRYQVRSARVPLAERSPCFGGREGGREGGGSVCYLSP